jgi:hypothetical protein
VDLILRNHGFGYVYRVPVNVHGLGMPFELYYMS